MPRTARAAHGVLHARARAQFVDARMPDRSGDVHDCAPPPAENVTGCARARRPVLRPPAPTRT